MKAINWIRFTWDLASLPESRSDLPEHYQIVEAVKDDDKELRRVIASSFTLDPSWNPDMQEAMQTIETWLDRASETDTAVFLALRHGTRIIGAAVVSVDPSAENHLAPGPCILMEYRNRGFGTRLLERSLSTLRVAGLTEASAIAKESSPATKFLYSKFASKAAPYETPSAVAA
jgi:hypothetical protein